MNKYYSFLILCFCLISCEDKVENKTILSVDLEDITNPSIYDLFANIDIISLETTNESLIKDISKVKYYKGKYYILDRPLYRILIFDDKGRYVNKIDNRGDGPNQYIDISDFDINKNTDQIVLLSAVSNSLSYYKIGGCFVNKIKLSKFGLAYKSLQYINNDTIAFWTLYYENRMKYYSVKKDKIVYEDFPEERKDVFCRNEFQMKGFLCRGLSNTVYSLKNGKTEKSYTWDFGENNDLSDLSIPIKSDYKAIVKFGTDVYSSAIVNYVFNIHGQNDQYIYTNLIVKNKGINIFYDKKNNRSHVFNKTKEGATVYPIEWTNDHIISIVSDHITLEDLVPSKIRTPELSKIINDIKEDDNPVLIKHTFL